MTDLAERLCVLAWAIRGLAASRPAMAPEECVQYAMAAELGGVTRAMESIEH